MKGEYHTDREFSDQHTAETQRILEDVVRQRLKIVIRPADFVVDTRQGTDFISGAIGPINFAARLRRPGVFWGRSFNSPTAWGLQFTIRSLRETGTETELAKFKKGFGHLFFYGHIEEGS
jgi:hypothetical protein